MKVLVLGSSGQIGVGLVEYLQRSGETVIPFDVARTREEDLRVMSARMAKVFQEADFVFFLAFDVGGSDYLARFQDTYEFIHNNIRLMANSFELLGRFKTPFIFASSQMASMSFSNYGVLKTIGERYTRALGGRTVKFWNVYGIERDPAKTHVITDFVSMAKRNRCIKMRTTGDEERQFLYADDCAEALRTLMQRYTDISIDAELHVTNFSWTKIRAVAEIVAGLFPGTNVIPGDKVDTVQAGQKNEPDPFILTLWKPKTSLEDGILKVAKEIR